MPWEKVTKESYALSKKVHKKKLTTLEYISRYGYFLHVQALNGDPFLKMEMIYENYNEPTKYWKWKKNSPT